MRYGVNISAATIEARKTNAARILQRGIRRWLIRTRIKHELRRPGYKYQSGVVRMLGLQLVYVMMNDDKENVFTLTLSERKSQSKPIFIVQRYILNDNLVKEAIKSTKEEDGPKFILEAVHYILDHFLLESCKSKLSAGKTVKDEESPNYISNWATILKQSLLSYICHEPKQLEQKRGETVQKVEVKKDFTSKNTVTSKVMIEKSKNVTVTT
jgi:hypothetical protein